jgi:hypothetical protein
VGRILPALVVSAVGVAVAVFVGTMLSAESKAPVATVTADGFTVKSAMYEARVPFAEVTDVALAPALPRILLRTNGFAAGGKLRGHFDVADMGNGLVFVDGTAPPFVVVKTTASFVLVGLEDPAATRAFHDELSKAWQKARGGR